MPPPKWNSHCTGFCDNRFNRSGFQPGSFHPFIHWKSKAYIIYTYIIYVYILCIVWIYTISLSLSIYIYIHTYTYKFIHTKLVIGASPLSTPIPPPSKRPCSHSFSTSTAVVHMQSAKGGHAQLLCPQSCNHKAMALTCPPAQTPGARLSQVSVYRTQRVLDLEDGWYIEWTAWMEITLVKILFFTDWKLHAVRKDSNCDLSNHHAVLRAILVDLWSLPFPACMHVCMYVCIPKHKTIIIYIHMYYTSTLHTYVHSYKHHLSFNNQFRKESQQCQGRSEASVEVMGEAGCRVGLMV